MESVHERMHCMTPTASCQHSGSTLNPTAAPQKTETDTRNNSCFIMYHTFGEEYLSVIHVCNSVIQHVVINDALAGNQYQGEQSVV